MSRRKVKHGSSDWLTDRKAAEHGGGSDRCQIVRSTSEGMKPICDKSVMAAGTREMEVLVERKKKKESCKKDRKG